MQVLEIKDAPDGGAYIVVSVTPEEAEAFIKIGIIHTLEEAAKTAIEQHQKEEDNGD